MKKIAWNIFLVGIFLVVLLSHFFSRFWAEDMLRWIVWGLTLSALLLWVLFSWINIKRWFQKRQSQFGLQLILSSVSVVILLGVLNWVAVQNNVKKDLTRNSIHSLSQQSQKILKGLNQKVEVDVWTSSISQMSRMRDMKRFFENYEVTSSQKIKIKVQDPNANPIEFQRINVPKDNVIVLRNAQGRQVVLEDYDDANAEAQITNAIANVTRDGNKKLLCFLSGHGELPLQGDTPLSLSVLKKNLEEVAYETRDISLATASELPAECEALVLAGPQTEALDSEISALKKYLSGGGKLLALMGAGVPQGWNELFKEYGVRLEQNIIVDKVVGPSLGLLTKNYSKDFGPFQGFRKALAFRFARSLKVPTKSSLVSNVLSSESATYAKQGALKFIRSLEQFPRDKEGPFTLGVFISKDVVKATTPAEKKESTQSSLWKKLEQLFLISSAHAESGGQPSSLEEKKPEAEVKELQKKTEILLLANHHFAADPYIVQMGNLDFVLNSVNFLMKDQDLIGIRPKEIGKATLALRPEHILQVRGYLIIIALVFVFLGTQTVRRRFVTIHTDVYGVDIENG